MKSIFLFLFLVLLFPVRAKEIVTRVSPDGTEFKIFAPISVLPAHGFFPVRVEIRSRASKPLTWKVRTVAEKQTYGSSRYRSYQALEGAIRSEYSVTCPAGEERKIDLLIPLHDKGDDRTIRFQCSTADESSSVGGSFSDTNGRYAMGVSGDFAQGFQAELEIAYSNLGSSSRASYYSSSVGGGEIDVARLPEDWRAYAGYDVLAVTRDEWLKLGPGVKLALDQWVRSGGNFILLNDGSSEVVGFESPNEVDGLGLRNRMDCGQNFQGFKGKAFANLSKAGHEAYGDVSQSEYDGGDWAVGQELGSQSRSKAFLLFCLIVFAIVVGPVNLFFWANKNRRHRLFVTTPIISVVASLIMVGFIVVRDGFGGDGARAIAIEVGGPDDKSAVILQEQYSRSGILFSSGFEMDGDSVMSQLSAPVTDLNRRDSVSSTGTQTLEFEQTKEGWKINGNLFQSRSEQAQLLRAVVPSRERLELLPGNSGAPRLASSFSYTLTDVFYRDGEGKMWFAAEISSGETISMEASSSMTGRDVRVDEAISRFGRSHRGKFNKLRARPNSFVALAIGAPSIATHSSIDWMESPTLITGLLSQ